VRILLEPLSHVRTASIGIWFAVGSREDPQGQAGVAHLLEHLVFKGGRRYGARLLAEAMDALGGQFNAFTTREHTCFHARTLGTRLCDALELLMEMVVLPRCDEAEAQRERQVVLDELAMIADDPGETAEELLSTALWGQHPLGLPQAGTPASVAGLDAAALRGFHAARYVGGSCVVAAAGRFAVEDVLRTAEAGLGGLPAGVGQPARSGPAPLRAALAQIRRSQQAHLCLGAPAPGQGDPLRWAAALFCSILGGSPSSRLFQAVREDRGLCYDVGAGGTEYSDAGELAIFLSTAPTEAALATRLALAETRRLAAEGPTAAELRRHQDQLVASVHMALEGNDARMTRLGRQAVAGLPLLPLTEVCRHIRGVTRRGLAAYAATLGDPAGWAAAFVGPRAAAPGPWAWRDGG